MSKRFTDNILVSVSQLLFLTGKIVDVADRLSWLIVTTPNKGNPRTVEKFWHTCGKWTSNQNAYRLRLKLNYSRKPKVQTTFWHLKLGLFFENEPTFSPSFIEVWNKKFGLLITWTNLGQRTQNYLNVGFWPDGSAGWFSFSWLTMTILFWSKLVWVKSYGQSIISTFF